jgi:glycyl-tRNA synthetase beta chain
MDFFADRLKVALKEQGVRHDLISAVFALGNQDDLFILVERAQALSSFLKTDDGTNLLTAFRRANNIVRIETDKDRKATKTSLSYDGAVEESLFQQPEEHSLAKALGEAELWFSAKQIDDDLAGAMGALAKLRQPVDAFFDKVTVNADDADIRANRLKLLSQISRPMSVVADFSRIEG